MKANFRTAFLDTVPVMTGYLFLGFGFGILALQSGLSLWWAMAMSVFIYAGSMQFVAVTLLSGGTGLLTAALTTLAVNARHLFYGISMIDRYKGTGRKKPYLIFSLTDETYSLVSQGQPRQDGGRYYLLVSLLDQCYWVLGTLLGAAVGQLLPINYEGIDFVLTALFVTIFVEQWLSTKKHLPALIGLGASVLCLILFGSSSFLIPSMGLIALLLLLTRGKEEAK
ncbi:MAG: AzlC family ABC transporter permease [Candidatus Faecousia sp.]|nr:AzlC family ABC transporter permease [Candidatus Faecousia sp.]